MMTTNHLESITVRQKSSRVRDAIFAACVALATIVGFTAVSQAATVAHVAK
ncbi:MAG: hypothetical protein QM831_04715 [Kofleriaceae bacterium]